ncbi:hypothetical protein [Nocardioides cynanchi]|uniref:hypothetical protein n=1 Tax=Nocardioides cynanchi TaxID=2558918 RepID=UPI0012450E7C|nr:hypothetical protein [Nocardioides cynanchi]
MPTPLTSDFLVPNGTLLVLAVLLIPALAVIALLVVWPLVETIARRRWGYLVGVLLLGPIGGLLWFAIGRPASSPGQAPVVDTRSWAPSGRATSR